MRIVFIGTVEFSLKALEKLVQIEANVVGVCTKQKSSFNTDFADLSPLCKSKQIPLNYVEDVNSIENINWIKQLNPDVIYCFGWSSLIKKELLSIPPLGIVGFHPSNLPNNKGRHPIIWALILGLKESASTFFFMNEKADDGDIISQQPFKISYHDDASTLYHKITSLALKQIESFTDQLTKSQTKTISQKGKGSNIWRKRSVKDGQIDFRMSSYAVYNLVRGLTKPYVGAHVNYQGENVIVWKVEEVKCLKENIEPGKVIDASENSITVKCYDKAIKIIDHEFKTMPKIGEYL